MKKEEETQEESVKEIPTRIELVQAKIPFQKIGSEIYFSVKSLKKKYPFLTNHKFDEKEFELEDDKKFIGIKISDLLIKKQQ